MLEVSRDAWRMIWPNAPAAVIEAFATKLPVLGQAGVLANRNRLAYFCANVEHECGGFALRDLTENILYTAARMAVVWPNRFASAAAVRERYGTALGWQLKAFDDIYGGRMGNRPGTHDGSTYIGRGGPQATGRDGYRHVGDIVGRDFETDYRAISALDLQPEVCCAFWTWKGLNKFADNEDFLGCVKIWNGGTNGIADRRALMAGNNPTIMRLQNVNDAIDVVNTIPSPSIAPAESPVGDVVWIQMSLNALDQAGKIKLPAPLETRTGIYGQKTHDAVEIFQRTYGLKMIDGVAGKRETIPALQRAIAPLGVKP